MIEVINSKLFMSNPFHVFARVAIFRIKENSIGPHHLGIVRFV